jgi:Ca-activated chloride channel family protein
MKVAWTTFFLLVPLLGLFWFVYRREKIKPALLYSYTSLFKKEAFPLNPEFFFLLAIGSFSLALLDFHFAQEVEQKGVPKLQEGPALYFLLDRSGSMREGEKMALMKKITREYLLSEERQNDAVGLVAFARSAEILSPLTFDHQAVAKKLETLTPIGSKREEGTAIGYAIYKTVSLLSLMPGLKEPAVIVVTDGIQLPHPEDRGDRLRSMSIEEAAAFAAENKVRVYILSIDRSLSEGEFVPIQREMEKASEKTGGKMFTLYDLSEMKRVYEEMDTLAFSPLRTPKVASIKIVRGFSLYPIFTLIGLVCMSLAALAETVWLRRVP